MGVAFRGTDLDAFLNYTGHLVVSQASPADTRGIMPLLFVHLLHLDTSMFMQNARLPGGQLLTKTGAHGNLQPLRNLYMHCTTLFGMALTLGNPEASMLFTGCVYAGTRQDTKGMSRCRVQGLRRHVAVLPQELCTHLSCWAVDPARASAADATVLSGIHEITSSQVGLATHFNYDPTADQPC